MYTVMRYFSALAAHKKAGPDEPAFSPCFGFQFGVRSVTSFH